MQKAESNEDLVKEYQKTKSNNCFKKLMENNQGLVHKIANSFVNNISNLEDYVQEGWVAFERAARKFDESRETKFSTIATTIIKNHLIQYKKNNNPRDIIFIPIDKIQPQIHYDRKAGQALDLDYALERIPPYQRNSILKCYFSNETLTKTDLTISRLARINMRKILLC